MRGCAIVVWVLVMMAISVLAGVGAAVLLVPEAF